MRIKDSFHLYAMITTVCWSLSFVYTRLALRYFTAPALGFLRYFVASIVLVLVAVVLKIKPPDKKDYLWFVISGISGFFLYMIIFNIGTGYVTAATSSIVIATTPIITALLASFFFHEKLKRYQWLAVAIEFAGILILTLMAGSFSANRGVLWLLAAAFLLSIYNLVQRKLTKIYRSLQVSIYSILIGTAMLAIFAPAAAKQMQQAPDIQFFLYRYPGDIFKRHCLYFLGKGLFQGQEYFSGYQLHVCNPGDDRNIGFFDRR